ncbi:putative RNA-directed DNA polymerase from transposon X-element [Trichonephila clavipes]|nr:putative RNA-directed DNA polymerase from transposon X-element [Trichonephila clavipes]
MISNPSYPRTSACVALQETSFLKSTMTMQVRGYNCTTGCRCEIRLQPEVYSSHLICIPVLSSHCTTSLQAVAVRIHIHSLVTVCCVYLPPNDVVPQVDLNGLVSQLPAPFLLLGDFNGHSPLWGHDVTNSRGRQIEQLISDHCLCLLNNDENTYFHAPTRTFHSLDLAICSPTLLPMLNFEVANDLHNSDHFLLLVSHVNGAGGRFRPPTHNFHRADWDDKFTRLAIITDTMVQNGQLMKQSSMSLIFGMLPMQPFPKHQFLESCVQTMVERFPANKPWSKARAWGYFQRYPTTDNLIAFKRAKALARRIRRQCQRESWIQYVSSITSSTTS